MGTERGHQTEPATARAVQRDGSKTTSSVERAKLSPGTLPQQLLSLQRSVGNQAVGQLIQRATAASFGFDSGGPILLINPDIPNLTPGAVQAFGISGMSSVPGWIEQTSS